MPTFIVVSTENLYSRVDYDTFDTHDNSQIYFEEEDVIFIITCKK